MQRLHKAQTAFTLVELMVVIAIIAILATVASPSFTEIKRNSELVSATNNLVASLNNARSEAMKNAANAGITPSTLGTDWNTAIILFIDKDFDGVFDTSKNDVSIKQTEILPNYLTITSSNSAATALLFNASGYLAQGFTNTTFSIARNDVPAAEQVAQTRRVVIAATGRVRSCKPTGKSGDDCKADSSN